MKNSAFDGNKRVSNVLLGNYIPKLPSETRVTNIGKELSDLWMTIKEKLEHGEARYIKEEIKQGLYNDIKAFEKFISGVRNPTLLFIQRFSKHSDEIINKCIDYKTILTKPLRFGDGGNAASAILPKELSPSLAYLIGAMRDGTLARGGKYEVSISQKNEEWLHLLKIFIKEIFHPSNEPRIVYRGTPRLIISNRTIFEFLNKVCEIPIGKKIEWETPFIIKKAPFTIQKYYIRGFFDADGLSNLGFCQVNYNALLWIKETLTKKGIKSGMVSQRQIRKNKHKICYFSISRSSYGKFVKIIGCSNSAKGKNFPSIQNLTSRDSLFNIC